MNPYIGKKWTCRVAQLDGRWVRLDPSPGELHSPPESWIPLLRSECPEVLDLDDRLEVFIYLDTLDEPLATTKSPRVMPGQAGFLQVVDAAPFGFFADWGLSRDLFIPFKESPASMEVGRSYAITPYVDASGRLAGSTRLHERLSAGAYRTGQQVQGVVWRREAELGTFVILDHAHLALLPADEPEHFKPGDSATFRISRVLPDGKVEVSARALAYQAQDADAEALLSFLRLPGATELGDYSDPETLRSLLGLSKKAVKRAAGALQRRGLLHIDSVGTYQLAHEAPSQADPQKGVSAPNKSSGFHVPRSVVVGRLDQRRGQSSSSPGRQGASSGPSLPDDGWAEAPAASEEGASAPASDGRPSRSPSAPESRVLPRKIRERQARERQARAVPPVPPEPAEPEPPLQKRPPRREFIPDPPRPRKRSS